MGANEPAREQYTDKARRLLFHTVINWVVCFKDYRGILYAAFCEQGKQSAQQQLCLQYGAGWRSTGALEKPSVQKQRNGLQGTI